MELLNSQEHSLGDAAERPKGFLQSHLLADSLDLSNNLLPNPMQKIYSKEITKKIENF